MMDKSYYRRYYRERYQKLLSENRCVACKSKLPDGTIFVRCDACREKARLYAAQQRQKVKIKITREIGVKREGDKVLCEKCGADLSSAKFMAHWDAKEEYGYVFECVKCGARIEQVLKRDKNTAWWG